MGNADKILPLIALALALWLVSIFLKRRLYWRFPCFFTYIVSVLSVGTLRFSVGNHYRTYFEVFWVSEVIYAVLSLLALHEVFRQIFFGFYRQFPWFPLLFPAAVAVALAIVLWNTLHSPPVEASPLIGGILLFGIAVNLIQVGVFCMFMLVTALLDLPWLDAQLGISLGFAVSAAGAVLGYWARSEFGTKLQTFSKYAQPVAYIVAMGVWLDTFLRPEPEPKSLTASLLRRMAEEVRRFTTFAKKLLE